MIDLHMHSFFSEDGNFTPEELVKQCEEKQIQLMSVTDHNCVKANERARAAAQKAGIFYISGIEIDCTYQDTNLHVLGYGMDISSQDFEEIEKNIENQGLHNSLEMLELTQCLGFHVTEQEMWKLSEHQYWKGLWTGEMFAEVLLGKEEYMGHPLLEAYRPGGARSDNPYVNFYWDFYSQGKPCYVKTEYPSAQSIVETIHRNGGIAVLAHPGVNLNHKEELLPEIMNLGMDGLEAFSSYHSQAQVEYFVKQGEKTGKIITCGSDFHGKTKPAIVIGQHHAGEKAAANIAGNVLKKLKIL